MLRTSVLAVAFVWLIAGCGGASFKLEPETLPQAAVGAPYSVDMSAISNSTGQPDTGIGLYTTGALPVGLAFSTDNHGRATLGGTPTAAGSYTFTVTAAGYCTNFTCDRVDRPYTLVVGP